MPQAPNERPDLLTKVRCAGSLAMSCLALILTGFFASACASSSHHRPVAAMALSAGAAQSAETAQGGQEDSSQALSYKTVEAEVRMTVEDIGGAAAAVRSLVAKLGGKISEDQIRAFERQGFFVARVVPERLDEFLSGLGALGTIHSRQIRSSDVSHQYVDNEICLDNLRKGLARYQELLKAAQNVEEVLKVEEQLQKTRESIERLSGAHRVLQDRVSLATVRIHLSGHSEVEFSPRAKSHPGARVSALMFLEEGKANRFYQGAGFSLYGTRAFHLDVQAFSEVSKDIIEADVLSVFVGGDAYSDFLGRGRRAWFNPHLGGGLGWLRQDDLNFLSAGVSLGVEIYKSKHVLWDLSLRSSLLLGQGDPRLALEPSMGLNVAF